MRSKDVRTGKCVVCLLLYPVLGIGDVFCVCARARVCVCVRVHAAIVLLSCTYVCVVLLCLQMLVLLQTLLSGLDYIVFNLSLVRGYEAVNGVHANEW